MSLEKGVVKKGWDKEKKGCHLSESKNHKGQRKQRLTHMCLAQIAAASLKTCSHMSTHTHTVTYTHTHSHIHISKQPKNTAVFLF